MTWYTISNTHFLMNLCCDLHNVYIITIFNGYYVWSDFDYSLGQFQYEDCIYLYLLNYQWFFLHFAFAFALVSPACKDMETI